MKANGRSMKFILYMILLLIGAANAVAGGYYSGESVDEYDTATGFYFKSVKNGVHKDGFFKGGISDNVSDIVIFDPANGRNVLVFNDKKPRKITDFIYESQYQPETRSMLFGSPDRHYSIKRIIKNNQNIEKRKPKDRLLLVVYEKDGDFHEMWSLNKSGENLKKIKTIGKDIDWHIDVKNSKIRFVDLSKGDIEIESLDW